MSRVREPAEAGLKAGATCAHPCGQRDLSERFLAALGMTTVPLSVTRVAKLPDEQRRASELQAMPTARRNTARVSSRARCGGRGISLRDSSLRSE